MYRVDFQKVKIWLGKFKGKIEDLENQQTKREKENDELISKKRTAEEQIGLINDEIGELQKSLTDLPEMLENLTKHLEVTQQEKRRLEKEYK